MLALASDGNDSVGTDAFLCTTGAGPGPSRVQEDDDGVASEARRCSTPTSNHPLSLGACLGSIDPSLNSRSRFPPAGPLIDGRRLSAVLVRSWIVVGGEMCEYRALSYASSAEDRYADDEDEAERDE